MIILKGNISTQSLWVPYDSIEFRAKPNSEFTINVNKDVITAKISGVEVRSKSLKIVDVNLTEVNIPIDGETTATIQDWFIKKIITL